jgi:hypothetical protein
MFINLTNIRCVAASLHVNHLANPLMEMRCKLLNYPNALMAAAYDAQPI